MGKDAAIWNILAKGERMEDSSYVNFVGRGKGREPGEFDGGTKNISKGQKKESYKIKSKETKNKRAAEGIWKEEDEDKWT